MDASAPSPPDSTPTPSSSPSSLPLSVEAYLAERSKREQARKERELKDLRQNAVAVRGRCQSLYAFVCEAWPVLEPNAAFVPNWHIKVICDHLEAVTDGRINRLLINVPPGSMKSLLVSVFWPAWEWGPKALRSLRYVSTAFNDGPVKRDTRKTRDLILSDWYQALWPEVELTRTAEMSFANSSTGSREGVAFGSLTSQRGDRLIIDDPHSVKTAESDAERDETTRLFREGAVNRLNDQNKSAIIVIMQRLHEKDMSGVILSLGMDYVHLCLPMEFDPDTRCRTSIGFVDPRTQDGELLDPVRFSGDVVEKFKRDMGSYAYPGQYQQRPGARGGTIFQISWWRYYQPELMPKIGRIIHSWDTAFKAKTTSDFSCRTIWAECENGYYLLDVWKQKVEFPALKRMVATFREEWKPHQIIIEDKASGQSLLQELERETILPIKGIPVDSDKVARAYAVTPLIEAGRVFLPEGAPWLADYVASMAGFPTGAHDDDVDSTTQALAFMSREQIASAGFLALVRKENAEREAKQAPGRMVEQQKLECPYAVGSVEYEQFMADNA